MATLPEVFRTTLEADTALMAILTGGIYDASEMDRDGVTVDTVLRDTTGRIKPFAVIRWTTATPGAFPGISNEGVSLWIYEDTGYAHIRAAIQRARSVLFGKALYADDARVACPVWAGSLAEQPAEELGGASSNCARFLIMTQEVNNP